MTWDIEFIPLLPFPLLWGALALAGLLSIALLWANRRGVFLRLLSLVLLLLALANPNLRQEDREALPNIAIVLADESGSQKIAGRAGRTQEVKDKLAKALAAFPNLEVRWISSSSPTEGGKEETALFADLNRALADIPPERLAGVIMITDGQVHDAPPDASRLGFDAPVHALITGSPEERDNRLEIVSAPRFGLAGSLQIAEIKAEAHGKGAPQRQMAELKVYRENKPVETLSVPFGKPVPLQFHFTHAGPAIMEVELTAEPGELTVLNNRVVLQAEGVRENLRVLLVSGEPHAGERTWRNLLRSDAAVDLVHFTILRPPEKQDGTPIHQLSLIAFPTRELFSEKLKEFDLVIFDRYQRRGVLPLIYLDNVARYVEQGGAVLVAAGADYASTVSLYRTPLADVLPARPTGRVLEQPFRPKVTGSGEKHPVTSSLPGAGSKGLPPAWGRWFRVVEAAPQGGEVIMTGAQDSPLLILSRQGQGRVAVLLSDHAWLWARGYEGGGPHSDLLRRLSHWLMKEPDLEEESLRASGAGRTLTIERRSMKDAAGAAAVTFPSGKTATVTLENAGPGLWRQSLAAEEPGVYRIGMDKLSAVALMGAANSREFSKVTATDALLKPVLEGTGGGVFWLGGASDAPKADAPRIVMLRGARKLHGQSWLGLKERDAHLVRGVQYTPLFAGFLALGLALGLIGLTWFRESR